MSYHDSADDPWPGQCSNRPEERPRTGAYEIKSKWIIWAFGQPKPRLPWWRRLWQWITGKDS